MAHDYANMTTEAARELLFELFGSDADDQFDKRVDYIEFRHNRDLPPPFLPSDTIEAGQQQALEDTLPEDTALCLRVRDARCDEWLHVPTRVFAAGTAKPIVAAWSGGEPVHKIPTAFFEKVANRRHSAVGVHGIFFSSMPYYTTQ